LDVIGRMGRALNGAADLAKPEVQAAIAAQVKEITKPTQGALPDVQGPEPNVAEIVALVAKQVAAGTIEIPEIVLLPDSAVSFTFRDFDLQRLDSIAYRPLADEIVVQQLRTQMKSRIAVRLSGIRQERLEDYVVAELIGMPEIDYDAHSDLLYKLAGQVLTRLRSYLANDDEVERVLLTQGKRIAEFVSAQMMDHYVETETTYRVQVTMGFQTLKKQNFSQPEGQQARDFCTAVTPRSDTRKHLFNGFKKCCYLLQQFHSDGERRFSVLIDDEPTVLRWVKPGRRQFEIWYRRGERYEPDFVVETATEKLICEIKARNEMDDEDVLAKANAARIWIGHANDHALATGRKPWRYALITDDTVTTNATLAGLMATYGLEAISDARPGS
jgi:type III restriction enzyme